jgi:hypothetical protein
MDNPSAILHHKRPGELKRIKDMTSFRMKPSHYVRRNENQMMSLELSR